MFVSLTWGGVWLTSSIFIKGYPGKMEVLAFLFCSQVFFSWADFQRAKLTWIHFWAAPCLWDGISRYFGWCSQERWAFCYSAWMCQMLLVIDVSSPPVGPASAAETGAAPLLSGRWAVNSFQSPVGESLQSWKGFLFYFPQAAQFPWVGTKYSGRSATWLTYTQTKFNCLHLFIGLKCSVNILSETGGIAAIAQNLGTKWVPWHWYIPVVHWGKLQALKDPRV